MRKRPSRSWDSRPGCSSAMGPEFAGTVFFDDLEIARRALGEPAPRLTRIVECGDPRRRCRGARAASNKGDFGRVLIVGSGSGMPGAARLAGEACLRVGAGLTTVAVAPENVAAIAAGRPGAHLPRAHRCERARRGARACRRDRGRPGTRALRLGAQRARCRCSTADKPLVVDADALNLLAEGRAAGRATDWILTPHPGEAGRLLGRAARRTSSMTAWPRSIGFSSASTARSCSRAPAPWWARAVARPGFASAAIPAWRPPAPGMC